jgi:uncharacterized protein YcfL
MKKLILFSGLFLVIGCSNNNKIEDNDIVKKCVIDSLKVRMERSTIEVGPFYIYHTDCGEVLQTRRSDIYKIGDTITYVYKRRKQ